MSRIKITNPNLLTGILYFTDPESKTNSKMARGALVGVVTCLMAQGKTFEQAIQIVKPYMPKEQDIAAFPDGWLEHFIDPKNVEVKIG